MSNVAKAGMITAFFRDLGSVALVALIVVGRPWILIPSKASLHRHENTQEVAIFLALSTGLFSLVATNKDVLSLIQLRKKKLTLV